MIRLLERGVYRLGQTKKHHTKILYLGSDGYIWVDFEKIGEVLVHPTTAHLVECLLSIGQYRLYQVKDEEKLNDNFHLELEIGRNQWQGYLLLTGLPTSRHKRTRIIPTSEVITDRSERNTKEVHIA